MADQWVRSPIVLLTVILAMGVSGCYRSLGGGNSGRDDSCDDGTTPACRMQEPVCESWEILAYQESCYACVNPETCRPWGEPGCENDADCTVPQYCNDCASSSCPDCLDCVAACSNHNCPTDPDVTCDMERPECGLQGVAVSQNGCWTCVDIFTCDPIRDARCDDGTQPICPDAPPQCESWEILAYQEYCYACVNPQTCHPWGEAGCESDQDCSPEQYCDRCGSSSCLGCKDCVPACIDHGCPTETLLLCYGVRPDCDPGQVAVIEDGCWVCVDMNTCQ